MAVLLTFPTVHRCTCCTALTLNLKSAVTPTSHGGGEHPSLVLGFKRFAEPLGTGGHACNNQLVWTP